MKIFGLLLIFVHGKKFFKPRNLTFSPHFLTKSFQVKQSSLSNDMEN